MDALLEAHETIHQRTEDEKDLTGMGTTIVVALFLGSQLYVAHVGDSRAYLVRAGSLRQLTEDHSIVAQILKKGMISAPEARTHRLRHVLSQALGSAPSLVPSLQSLDLQPGDSLLLCTDGLTDMLSDSELLSCAESHPDDPQAVCDELVDRANAKGGRDNISVIVALNE
jgi:protein phosphatase